MISSRIAFIVIAIAAALVAGPARAEDLEDATKRAQARLTECYTSAVVVLDDEGDSAPKDEVLQSVLTVCRPVARRYADAARAFVGSDMDEEEALEALEDNMTPKLLDEIEYQRSQRRLEESGTAGGAG